MTNVKIAEKSPIVNMEAGVTVGERRALAAESSENTEIRQEFADRTAGGAGSACTVSEEEIEREFAERVEEDERLNRITMLQKGLKIVSDKCDGSKKKDGEGFARKDTDIGKQLAGKPITEWSDTDISEAARMCIRYQGQINSDEILQQAKSVKADSDKEGCYLPLPPPFPLSVFLKRFQDCIDNAGRAFKIPHAIPATTLLSLVGACIGRKAGSGSFLN